MIGANIFQEPTREDNSGNLVDDNKLFLTAQSFSYINTNVYASIMSHNEEKSPRMAIRGYLRTKSWDSELMYEIIGCESGFNERAYNPERHNGCGGSFGLAQIACVHLGKYGANSYEELYDWKTNIDVAYEVWKAQGYKAWLNCYNKIKYDNRISL